MPKNEVTAASTKSRPPVHDYLQQHQAPVAQEPVEQRAVEAPRLFNVSRDQILARLWEIAHMNPEITRGSLSGQVKALSMIVAIEGLIPDRRAASAHNKPAPPPVTADIYPSEWLSAQQDPKNGEPPRTPSQEETAAEPSSAPDSPPHQAAPGNGTPTPSLAPRVPMADHFAPDTRVPFSIKKNPFAPRR